MVQAYVLIRILPGRLSEALAHIQRTPGVKMAHAVTGPTDIEALEAWFRAATLREVPAEVRVRPYSTTRK